MPAMLRIRHSGESDLGPYFRGEYQELPPGMCRRRGSAQEGEGGVDATHQGLPIQI